MKDSNRSYLLDSRQFGGGALENKAVLGKRALLKAKQRAILEGLNSW